MDKWNWSLVLRSFYNMCITWRGPSVPSPQIEAVGKFVSARTIRSAWPWILKLMDLTGQLFSRFSSCQITIDARTWRRSGERQGGTPFSTIFEFVRWSCQQSSSSSGVYNGCCSTTIGNYDLSEYCLLANSNFPGHNFICSNVLLDAWKPPTDNLVYSTDPNVGVNILTYNSHTVIFELILHASHAAMMFTAEGQRGDFLSLFWPQLDKMLSPRCSWQIWRWNNGPDWT